MEDKQAREFITMYLHGASIWEIVAKTGISGIVLLKEMTQN